MKLSHCAAALFFLLPIAASAADCDHPPGGIGLGSAQANLQCAEKTRAATDQKLNDIYQKLLATLRDDPKRGINPHSDLIAAQRAWIAYRDAECGFRNSLSSGAPQWAAVNRSECLTDLTAARAKNLAEYLQQAQAE